MDRKKINIDRREWVNWMVGDREVHLPAVCFIILSFVICVSAVILVAAPLGRMMQVGDTVTTTIKATEDLLDTRATQSLKDEAEQAVQPVYSHDSIAFESVYNKLDSFLSSMDRLPTTAQNLRTQVIQSSERNSPLRYYAEGTLTSDEWEMVLEGDAIASLRETLDGVFTDQQIYQMLALSQAQYTVWLREVSVRINAVLREGVTEDNVSEIRKAFCEGMNSATPIQLKPVVESIADVYIQSTMFFDADATQEAKMAARSSVQEVIIPKDEVVLEAGEVIDDYHYQILNESGYIQSLQQVLTRIVGIVLFYSLAFLLFCAYANCFFQEILQSTRLSLLLSILLMLTIIFNTAVFRISPYINLVYFGMMLITQLVSVPAAVAVSIFLAPTLGLLSGGLISFDYYYVVQNTVATLAGALVGIYSVRNASRRMNMLGGGILSGLSAAIVYALFGILHGSEWIELLQTSGYALTGSLISAIVGVGILPLLETIFDVATPSRLMELGDINHPLLRRLMIEAPGTYNHSIMVGSLAEACANAIGANSTLVRVGSYFHDIGKLRRPLYFSENQRGDNPHDQLDAETSAAIITAHTKDGIELADKYKLPRSIRNIIAQHHGTSRAAYFYYKAVKESGGEAFNDHAFRYEGPKPQTIESAIVMIADSVEAAVRSMDNPDMDMVAEMVDKVIEGKFAEKQLTDCKLTFTQMDMMRLSILQVYQGSMHVRVEYPDIKQLKEELRKPALGDGQDQQQY